LQKRKKAKAQLKDTHLEFIFGYQKSGKRKTRGKMHLSTDKKTKIKEKVQISGHHRDTATCPADL